MPGLNGQKGQTHTLNPVIFEDRTVRGRPDGIKNGVIRTNHCISLFVLGFFGVLFCIFFGIGNVAFSCHHQTLRVVVFVAAHISFFIVQTIVGNVPRHP